MAPYLLFGFFIAGILSIFLSAAFVEKHLGGHGIWPVIKASLLGVPLPLCSCGVIPVATSLSKHGSSKGATTAFLLSTPQTGVDSILATYGLLGPVFAIFRPIAAFAVGLIGGSIVSVVDPSSGENAGPEKCEDECCAHKQKRSRLIAALRHGFVVLPRDIAKPLLVGLVIAGAIATLVPENFFSENLGVGLVPMLVMMAVGIPLYVCATASIPIAAMMIMKGVTPGAALVFLMTGPATNAATIATLWKMFGRRTTLVYLAVVALTALGSGILLDYFFTVTDLPAGMHHAHMLPEPVKVIAAVLLIILTVAAALTRKHKDNPAEKKDHE
jgi:uncharacterized membrane protein YraQ (UPF0718 family)